MTRTTSIAVWRQINAEGLLPQARLSVYNWLYRNGPATGREIEEGMRNPYAHVRLHELSRQGVVRERGVRQCRITGREVIAWDVTDALPAELRRVSSRVREVIISVVLHPDAEREFHLEQLEAMFPEMLDYDVRNRIRNARDCELRRIRERYGDAI